MRAVGFELCTYNLLRYFGAKKITRPRVLERVALKSCFFGCAKRTKFRRGRMCVSSLSLILLRHGQTRLHKLFGSRKFSRFMTGRPLRKKKGETIFIYRPD